MLGQKVNFSKSSLLFSKNTKADLCIAICSILNVTQMEDPSKYLDLPSLVGKNKRSIFAYLEHKIKQRLGG